MKYDVSPAIFLSFLLLCSCGKDDHTQRYTSIVEATAIQIPALTGGEIVVMNVEEGDLIPAKAVIAVTDTTELTYQRQQLEAALEELQGQLKIARANLEQAKVNHDYISEKQQRIKKLYTQNSTSRQTLDDLTNQLRQAQTALETAEQNFQTIEARRKQLVAQIKSLEKKIHDAVIISPAAGTISEKYFERHEAIPPFTPIVELLNLQQVEVKIYISEIKLPEIRRGQEARVHVDGLEQELTGKVAWISQKAEFTPKSILTPDTRTSLVYAVKLLIENPEGILKHGMPVEIILEN